MERKRIIISGHVQGIFFRAHIKEMADKLNLKGNVKNLPDGKVEITLEGESKDIEQLIVLCKKGPKNSYIKNIDLFNEKPKGNLKNFEIIY